MKGASLSELYGTINRGTLSQEVADRVQRLIEKQSLGIGSALPSENALADTFGVSRTVIREALKILKTKGLVTIQPGRGTVVSNPSRQAISDTLRLYMQINPKTGSFESLYEVREVLEGRIAELAAQRRTDDDLARLRSALSQMKQGRSEETKYIQADLAFHQSLARATHNELFELLLEPITRLLIEVIYLGRLEPTGVTSGIAAHERVLQCVEAGDAAGARKHMLDHVLDSKRRVEGLQAGSDGVGCGGPKS